MKIKDVFSLKIRDIFSLIISLPITIYVNFRCLPFKTALKLPLFIGYKTHIDKLSRNTGLVVCQQRSWFALDRVVQREEKWKCRSTGFGYS